MNISGDLVATLPFDPTSKVEDLKRQLAGGPVLEAGPRSLPSEPRLELVFRDETLRDGRSIAECGVEPGASLLLVHVPRALVLSASFDSTVRLWDAFAAEEGPLRTVCETDSPVTALCPEPGGLRLIVGFRNGALRLLDLGTGECSISFRGHREAVSCVTAAWSAQKFLTASWDHTLALWDLQDGTEPLRTFKGHSLQVLCASMDWEVQRAASASLDGTLQLWDLGSEHSLEVFAENNGIPVLALQVDWSAGQALAGLESGVLQLWDVRLGRVARALRGHDEAVWSIDADWHGQRALSGSADATLRLWDLAAGETVRVLSGHAGIIWRVVVDWVAARAVSASHDLTLRVWDLEDPDSVRVLKGHKRSVLCAALL